MVTPGRSRRRQSRVGYPGGLLSMAYTPHGATGLSKFEPGGDTLRSSPHLGGFVIRLPAFLGHVTPTTLLILDH